MVKLVIIADDFTGALDTSVPFAERGIGTRVVIGSDYDFSGTEDSAQVVAIDTETRRMTPEEAYRTVFTVAHRARKAGIAHLYKKTDSALRGCVGSELAAMLDASGASQLMFLPAYPKQRRTTLGGIQYLDGIPIHESVFGKDPFEPTLHSYIPDLIGEQSDVDVQIVRKEDERDINWANTQKRILVFDSSTDEDLARTATLLQANGKLNVLAGCAGLAEVLPDLIGFECTGSGDETRAEGLIVVCGSLNPITQAQIMHARGAGFHEIHLTPEQKLKPGYLKTAEGLAFLEYLRKLCAKHKQLVLNTLGENGFERTDDYAGALGISRQQIRKQVSRRLGELAKELSESFPNHALLLTGGDTLLGFMNQIDCAQLQPIKEAAGGAVLSRVRRNGSCLTLITKSGGLGKRDILVEIARSLFHADGSPRKEPPESF